MFTFFQLLTDWPGIGALHTTTMTLQHEYPENICEETGIGIGREYINILCHFLVEKFRQEIVKKEEVCENLLTSEWSVYSNCGRWLLRTRTSCLTCKPWKISSCSDVASSIWLSSMKRMLFCLCHPQKLLSVVRFYALFVIINAVTKYLLLCFHWRF